MSASAILHQHRHLGQWECAPSLGGEGARRRSVVMTSHVFPNSYNTSLRELENSIETLLHMFSNGLLLNVIIYLD